MSRKGSRTSRNTTYPSEDCDRVAIKTKNLPKPERPEREKEAKKSEPKQSFGKVISEVTVSCKCNKCGTVVEGLLIGSVYLAIPGLEAPFISYDCRSCGHSGRRTVQSKAVPSLEFEKKYKL